MIYLKQNLLPIKGFSAFTLLFFVFIRKDWWNDSRVTAESKLSMLKHESYHGIQQLICIICYVMLFSIANIWLHLSWWLLCLAPTVFYVIYVIDLIFHGYKNNIFEKPAYKHNLTCKCNKFICKYLNSYWLIVDDVYANAIESQTLIDSLNKQLSTCKTELTKLQQNNLALSTTYSDLLATYNATKAKYLAVCEQVTHYSEQIATMQQQINDLKQQIEDLQKDPEGSIHDDDTECNGADCISTMKVADTFTIY